MNAWNWVGVSLIPVFIVAGCFLTSLIVEGLFRLGNRVHWWSRGYRVEGATWLFILSWTALAIVVTGWFTSR